MVLGLVHVPWGQVKMTALKPDDAVPRAATVLVRPRQEPPDTRFGPAVVG